jgi:hypothetical protein
MEKSKLSTLKCLLEVIEFSYLIKLLFLAEERKMLMTSPELLPFSQLNISEMKNPSLFTTNAYEYDSFVSSE